MILFTYDKTFEGLLTVVFDAYDRKVFPDALFEFGEPLPLFYERLVEVETEPAKADRVWRGLKKKLSATGLAFLMSCWLSELPGSDVLLVRYMRKVFDSPGAVEFNFGDPDVLEISKISKKVNNERERVLQFVRFQKTADEIYFAAVEPLYNVLSLAVPHFRDRYRDQKWLIYDVRRDYGYYYDLKEVTEVHFGEDTRRLLGGRLTGEWLAEDEKQYQKLWKEYFKSITIRERFNPKLHRQHMPPRFWKYLPEKY